MSVPTATGEPDPAVPADAPAASATALRPPGSRSERAWRAGLQVLRRDSTMRRSLALADGLALVTGLAAAAAVEGDSLLLPGLLALPVLIVVAKVMGLYDRDAALL